MDVACGSTVAQPRGLVSFFENWTRQLERHGMLELNSTISMHGLVAFGEPGQKGKTLSKFFMIAWSRGLHLYKILFHKNSIIY